METKDLVFKNGHFYDPKAGARIEFREGAEARVTADASCFIPFTSVGTSVVPEKLGIVQNELIEKEKYGLLKCKKIYSKGDFLYFSVHRKMNKKTTIVHEFEVKLLEDLYFYLKKEWKLQEERLFDCACIVRQNITGTIDDFQAVNARSLNEAYKNTFVHYFGNKGNPACNAIDRFYDKPGNENSTINRFRESVIAEDKK